MECKLCGHTEENKTRGRPRKVCQSCEDKFSSNFDVSDGDGSKNRSRIVAAAKKMIGRARGRGKYEVAIEVDDVLAVWPKDSVCPILEEQMQGADGSTGSRDYSPSLDRIDNSKGYLPDNIQVISDMANKMKTNSTIQQQIKYARWILENTGGNND